MNAPGEEEGVYQHRTNHQFNQFNHPPNQPLSTLSQRNPLSKRLSPLLDGRSKTHTIGLLVCDRPGLNILPASHPPTLGLGQFWTMLLGFHRQMRLTCPMTPGTLLTGRGHQRPD